MNIVVTGGTKGIGRAAIEVFAAHGFRIFTCSRSENDLETLRREITEMYPEVKLFTEVCDMGDKAAVILFSKKVTEQFDTVDVLINNAGLFLPGTISEEDEGTFETMINVNIGGAYHLTRALLPLVKRSKGGHIFNMCSTASITAYTNGGSYCISKFAMLGFSRVLREELKTEKVRVTAVLPGATLTDSWAGTTLSGERFMQSSDIARAVWDCYSLKTAVVEELLLRPQLGDI
jgi:short-subunit dehydrogenase